MTNLRPIDNNTRNQLNYHLSMIETAFDADVISIVCPMSYPLDSLVKEAIEQFKGKRKRIAVILDTLGGISEVVERMVNTIRHHYGEVYFIIPDKAMSAGTIFAMSGDKIFMSYFSVLGPIDPQIEKDGKFIPAQSYLSQYKQLCKKAEDNQLNTAEFALLNKLDLGELHQFQQAVELSVSLLEKWLSQYKFKDWYKHSSTGEPVTDQDKRDRAKEIGELLNNNEHWHSHGRGISRETLTNEVRVKIDKIEDVPNLDSALDDYFALLKDYMQRGQYPLFIHTREYF